MAVARITCHPGVPIVNRRKAISAPAVVPDELEAGKGVDVISFYRANEKPFGAFSNLFCRPVEFEGVVFPTAEHAYQAGKAAKAAVRDWI